MPPVTTVIATLPQRLSVFLLSGLLVTVSACALQPTQPALSFAQGDSYFEQGDVSAALLSWEKLTPSALEQRFELALRQSRAYRELGNGKAALQSAKTAQELAAQSTQLTAQLIASIELGLAQLLSGQFSEAKANLVIAQGQAKNNPAEQALIELGLASIAKTAEQLKEAAVHYQKAQTLAQQSHNAQLVATIALLRVQLSIDSDKASASALWSQALQSVQALAVSKRSVFALIHLARIAQTEQLVNDDAQLLQLLKQAEQRSETLNDARLLSYALGYQGSWHEKHKQWQQAEQLTAKAADAAQRNNTLESLYLWEWQAARLHAAQHRDEQALAAYRRAVFSLQQVRQELATSQSFREQINPLFLSLADVLLQKARASHDPAQTQALLQEARSTVEQLKSAELQDYFQDRCVANFKEKSQGLEQVAKKTAVLYPILLPDRVEILLSFQEGLQQFIVPVSSQVLNEHIHDFRYKLEKRTTFQYLQAAKQLHQWLIQPLLPALHSHQIETLVIVPDGALRSIPFAALYDGKQYLIEQFALATTPSLSLTNPQSLPASHIEVLLNGLTQSVQGFAALPNVKQELQAIHEQFEHSQVLENQDFQSSSLGNALLNSPYRIVHIASHGQFDRNPKATFLLSYDGRITMDVLEQYLSASKYRDQPVELLTLSACQTAAGDDRAALGMAGVAVKAGARSALASLWFINDQASSDLITQFYSQLKQGATKAQALRAAQLSLLKDNRYNHASYWAAFLLIGNWL